MNKREFMRKLDIIIDYTEAMNNDNEVFNNFYLVDMISNSDDLLDILTDYIESRQDAQKETKKKGK